jgi:hypothetical protein
MECSRAELAVARWSKVLDKTGMDRWMDGWLCPAVSLRWRHGAQGGQLEVSHKRHEAMLVLCAKGHTRKGICARRWGRNVVSFLCRLAPPRLASPHLTSHQITSPHLFFLTRIEGDLFHKRKIGCRSRKEGSACHENGHYSVIT